MDRKELVAILVLGVLVVIAATVRIWRAPGPRPERTKNSRAPVAPGGTAPRDSAAGWPFEPELYLPPDAKARAQFDDAENLFLHSLFEATPYGVIRKRPLDDAIGIYQHLRVRYPDDRIAEIALLRIAQCYTVTRRHEHACRAYDRFLELYPQSSLRPIALLWSGDARMNAGEYEPARQRLNDVIQHYPNTRFAEGALVRLAQSYTLEKRYPEAAHAYDDFLQRCPDSELRPLALLWSGDSHQRLGEHELARQRLEEVVRQHAASPFVEGARRRLKQLPPTP
jgi:outer membrane protein assembly factor BamD (BamD/ComL family)